MHQDEEPRVVDLNRYRRAAAERTRARSRPQPAAQPGRPRPGGKEPLVGRHRHAKLILALAAAAALLLTAGPYLLR